MLRLSLYPFISADFHCAGSFLSVYINSTQLWKCFTGVCLQSQNSIRKFKINSMIISCFHICTVALNCFQQVRMEIFNTDGSNISWFLTCQSTSTKSLCCMTVWCLYPAAHPYITLTYFLLCGVVCGSSAALWRPFYHTFIFHLFWGGLLHTNCLFSSLCCMFP